MNNGAKEREIPAVDINEYNCKEFYHTMHFSRLKIYYHEN